MQFSKHLAVIINVDPLHSHEVEEIREPHLYRVSASTIATFHFIQRGPDFTWDFSLGSRRHSCGAPTDQFPLQASVGLKPALGRSIAETSGGCGDFNLPKRMDRKAFKIGPYSRIKDFVLRMEERSMPLLDAEKLNDSHGFI